MTTTNKQENTEGWDKKEIFTRCTFCGKLPIDWDEECDGEGHHEDYVSSVFSLLLTARREERDRIIEKLKEKQSKGYELSTCIESLKAEAILLLGAKDFNERFTGVMKDLSND